MKTIKAALVFTGDSTFNVLTDIEDLQPGDTVVVSEGHRLTIASVDQVHQDTFEVTHNRWAVQKVDLSAHKERVERGMKLLELQHKMGKRRKEMDNHAFYAFYATQDPEMAKLFRQYQEVLEGQ